MTAVHNLTLQISLGLLFTLVQTAVIPQECNGVENGLVASTKNCAQYYDCRDPTQFAECPYPKLFDEQSKKCIMYNLVDCKNKKQPIDPCDYVFNTCKYARGHCAPCWTLYPACSGKPNGNNLWEGKEHSPYYVVCKDERIVKHGFCGGSSIFDADVRKCVMQKK